MINKSTRRVKSPLLYRSARTSKHYRTLWSGEYQRELRRLPRSSGIVGLGICSRLAGRGNDGRRVAVVESARAKRADLQDMPAVVGVANVEHENRVGPSGARSCHVTSQRIPCRRISALSGSAVTPKTSASKSQEGNYARVTGCPTIQHWAAIRKSH